MADWGWYVIGAVAIAVLYIVIGCSIATHRIEAGLRDVRQQLEHEARASYHRGGDQ